MSIFNSEQKVAVLIAAFKNRFEENKHIIVTGEVIKEGSPPVLDKRQP
jgi:hypothetical protein